MQEDAESVVEYRVEAPARGGEVASAAAARDAVRTVADRLPTPSEPTRTEVTVRRTDGEERVTYEVWRPPEPDDPGGLLYRGGRPWRPPVDIDANSFGFGEASDVDRSTVDAVSVALVSTDVPVIESALEEVSDAAGDLSAEAVATLSPWLLQRLAIDAGLGGDDASERATLGSSLRAVGSLVNAGHEEVAADGVLDLLAVIARSDTNALAPATTHVASNAVKPAVDVTPGTLSMAVADIERAVTEGPASSALCGSILDALEALGMIGRVAPDATASVSAAYVVGAKHDDEYVRRCTLSAIDFQFDASDSYTVGAEEALGIFLGDDDLEKRERAVEMLAEHGLRPEGDVADLRRWVTAIRDETDDDAVENNAEALIERLVTRADGDSVLAHGTVEEAQTLLDTSTVDNPVFFDASATVCVGDVEHDDEVAFHHVTVDDVAASIDGAGIATVVVPTDSSTEEVPVGNETSTSDVDETSTDDDAVENNAEALIERLATRADGDSVLAHGTVEEAQTLLDTSTVDNPVFFDASATVCVSEVEHDDEVAFHHVTVDDVAASIDGAGIATVVVPTGSLTEEVLAGNETSTSDVGETSTDDDTIAAAAASDDERDWGASAESKDPSPEDSSHDEGASSHDEGFPPESIPTVDADDIDASEFTTGEVIGRGGNADIYRADVSRATGPERVAVKRPRFSGTVDREEIERLLDEAETWDRVDGHEHVTSVIDWGVSDGLPWIAMEYMDGGNLTERASTEDLSLAERAWTALALAKAVAHAHRFGIVHLDLKPANVLFRRVEDGWDVPKVADWGLSRALATHSMTVDGVSPSYAAPEQFDSEAYGDIGPETDVYQLGVLVYELFTGETPFSGGAAEVLRGTFDETPTPPTERADVPPELDDIVTTALAKGQGDRYEHVLYMRDDLRALWESVRA